ncbi:IclR family transcriptional regulator [Cupriavidus metallidurans]|uniref:IclR family transcriptional regulator n=1 Tax=Cupriavidus metallidurans TaxID=119219 RepID=UPI001CCF19E4|nr:IclR family transcriptional regulator [Cupriavidus metallidurans]UBM08483.1 IclR family transcriptional regulator [Cupriavidus metallidurans]
MKKTDNALGSTPVSGTQTIQRAAFILRLLSAHNRTGMRLADIYRDAMLERSTAHRILQGLVTEQLVTQHPASKRYYLGSSIYEMGLAAAPRFQLRDVCHPHIKALAEKTEDTVFLTVRSGFNGICVDRLEGSFPIRAFVLEVGRPRPLNIGGGNVAILSTLPDEEIHRICRANESRISEAYPSYSDRVLWDKIKQVRSKGFLLNRVLEAPSALSVAVPIRAPFEKYAVAAVSISAVASRLQNARVESVAALLQETVQQIEQDIAAAHG